jgi:hypothetical protein
MNKTRLDSHVMYKNELKIDEKSQCEKQKLKTPNLKRK